MAQGFTLNIDDKLLNNLITADKLVQQLGKSSEQTRDRFNKAFADMAQVGVDGLIRRLEEAKRKIDDMGGSVGSDKGLSSISTQAIQSADTIQQLIQVITQLHTAVNKKQMSDALKIRPEDLSAKQIAALTKQMAKERIAAHIAASKTITQSVNTEQKTIVETVKASGKEEIQAIKNKTNEKIALQNSESKNIIETINAENRLAIQAIRAKTNEQLAQEKNASEQILAGYRVRKAAISDSARLEAAANKENTNTLIRYMKVMNMSELTADSRYKKLANLDLILKELQRDEAKFANEISKAKAKMEELSNAEGKAATSSARLSSMTMQEALAYSKNTKSINDQLQAIKALKAARANLSKEGLSDKQYRDNINKLTEEIKRQQNEVNKLIGKHQNLSNGLNKLGPLIAQVFSVNAIKNFVQKLVSVRGEYEQQHRAIQVLLQDYNKANNIWNKTIQLAVKSPYTIQQLTSYTKQLAAYRIESSKLYDTTKRLADVSVGLGVDMQRVVLAYGQVRAANFLRGTELRQFTEAGIPMLDELAKYFSAVEHTTVTAAQVFERISKRQVLFTDVDAVIKKMTDAGGVFYNMQEEMANTLKGMSANLKDKVFLMFNEIGTEQQGLLTVLIKLAGLLTEHWRTLSAVLTIVAIVAILKFTASIWASIASLKALDFKVKVTKANLLSLASTWKGLATIMFTTPWGLALTGIITVATGLFTLNQKTKAQNRELEKLSANIHENISKLDAQKRKIEENNKTIQEGENITNKSADDENKLAKAREENARILADLKSKYPEYYDSIIQQKNGIIELTEAVEGYTDALAQQASIALLSKGGWFYDSLKKNSKDFTETLAEQQELLRRAKSSYESERIELSLEKSQGEISDSRYKKELKRLNDLIYITEEALNTITNFKGKSIKELEDLGGSYSLLLGDFSDVIQTIMSTIAGSAEDAWDNLEKGKFIIADTIKKYNDPEKQARYVHDTLSKMISDENLISILEAELNKFFIEQKVITVPLDFNFKIDDGKIEKWQENYNKVIGQAVAEINQEKEENEQVFFQEITVGTAVANTRENVIKKAQDDLQTYSELLDAVNKKLQEKGTIEGTAYEGESVKKLEAQIEMNKKILDFFGAPYTKGKKKGKDDTEERFKRQLALIKTLRQEFIKLEKVYGETEATSKIKEHYQSAFDEIFEGTGINWDFIFNVDEEGYVNALGELRGLAQKAGKAAEDAFEKELSGAAVDAGIKKQEKANEKKVKELEKFFEDYQLSLDLEKLGFSQEQMKTIFNFDYIDLGGLRTKFNEQRNLFIGQGSWLEGEYEKIEKRLNKLESDSVKERAKKYIKYLLKSQREAVKIKTEEAADIAAINKLVADRVYTKTEGAKIIEGIKAETQKELDKIIWEDFKGTDMYSMMFEDLEHYGTIALNGLKNKIEELKQNLSHLPASEMKEIISQLEKIEEITTTRRPMEAIASQKEIIERKGLSRKDAETKLVKKGTEVFKLQQEIDFLTTIQNLQATNTELTKEQKTQYQRITDEQYSQTANLQKQIDDKTELLTNAKNEVETAKEAAKAYADLDDARGKALGKISQILESVQKASQSALGLMEALGVATDSVAYAQAEAVDGMITLTLQAVQFHSQMVAVGYASNMALGVIGWIAMGIQALTSAISAITKIHDAKLDNEIQKYADNVEKLQKEFEALNESIDAAYDTSQLKRAAADAKQYTQQMINSYQQMILLEEQKKKTDKDKIEEYKESIAEQQKALEDLENQMLESMGGVTDYRSKTEDFLNSWIEAYKKVGDGLGGLQDNFTEFFDNIISQQASMKVTEKFLEPFYKNLNTYLDDYELSKNEMDSLRQQAEKIAPELSNYLEELWNILGGSMGENGGSLSGLQQGIQGMTEDTAQILASYLNSIRFFVSDNNNIMKQLRDYIISNDDAINPMLAQMRIIAKQTASISELLNSVTATNSDGAGQRGIRVYMPA